MSRIKSSQGRIHALTLSALLTALLCIAGPLTLPIGPVPVSLVSAAVMLAALLLGPGQAVACVAGYLLLGAAGAPVFSGFTGGAGMLIGPTGGFLLGYLPLAAIGGAICARCRSRWLQAAGLALGMLSLYALGAAWYCLYAGVALPAALAVCVWPFLPIDAAKLLLAVTFGAMLRLRLQKAGLLR